jgi:hypothetical protein
MRKDEISWAVAKMGAELSIAVGVIEAITAAGDVFQVDQVMKDSGVNTKFVCKALDTKANLSYQKNFPTHVFHMFEDKVRITSECDPARSHHFAIYHPGSETFAAIRNQLHGKKEFIGCFNDMNALGISLLHTRKTVGPNAVLHVLFPSGHKYSIDETIHIPPNVLPLRICGETHADGSPYVSAKLNVTGDFESKEVDITFRKRDRLAASLAGAFAEVQAGGAVALANGVSLLGQATPLALKGFLPAPGAEYFTGKAGTDVVVSEVKMKKKKKKFGMEWLQ